MTRYRPLRAGFVTTLMVIFLLVGVAVELDWLERDVHSLSAALHGVEPFSGLWPRIAAWLALASAALAISLSFLVWLEDDSDGRRRLGVSPLAPFLFLALTLALLWFALRGDPPASIVEEPIAEPVALAEPEAEEIVLEGAPQEPPPPIEPEPIAPPPSPQVEAMQTPISYAYSLPRIAPSGAGGADGIDQELNAYFSAQPVLCGKAWVALTGAASQEGPVARNERRARLRAERAIARARLWLAEQGPACARPVLIGVDLGQHAAVLANPAADGSDSGNQRQVIVIGRDLAPGESGATSQTALAELAAYYADPAGRAQMLAGRVYTRDPVFFVEHSR